MVIVLDSATLEYRKKYRKFLLFSTSYFSPPLIQHFPINTQTSHINIFNLSFGKKAVIYFSNSRQHNSVPNKRIKQYVPPEFEKVRKSEHNDTFINQRFSSLRCNYKEKVYGKSTPNIKLCLRIKVYKAHGLLQIFKACKEYSTPYL